MKMYSFLFLCLVVWLHGTLGMIDTIKSSIGHELRTLHQFQFGSNGRLELTINSDDKSSSAASSTDSSVADVSTNSAFKAKHISSAVTLFNTLYLYHCTDNELKAFNSYSQMTTLCASISDLDCEWSATLDSTVTDLTYEFQSNSKKQWMTLLALNCDEYNSFDISATIVAKNGKNEYLSLSEVPYKTLYLYLGGLWSLTAAFWCIHWWRYIYFNTKLQQLISLYPILKCLSCAAYHFFWAHASHYGTEPSSLTLIANITDGLSDAYLVLCLMYMAEGWGLIIHSLPNWWRFAEVWSIFIAFFVSSVLVDYYNTVVTVLVLCFIFALHRMLRGYTTIHRWLNTQKAVLEDVSPTLCDDPNLPLNIKLDLLLNFQRGVTAFVVTYVLFQWGKSVFMELPWLNTLLQAAIFWCLVIYLGWTVRMRPFRPLFYVLENENAMPSIDNPLAPYGGLPAVWKPGQTKPLLPKDSDYDEWLCLSQGDIIVMTNEIDIDSEGDYIQSFSLVSPLTFDDEFIKSRHPHNNATINNAANDNSSNSDSHNHITDNGDDTTTDTGAAVMVDMAASDITFDPNSYQQIV